MTIVTPSKWLANLVNESFLSKYEVKVINNGIDLKVFKPTEGNFREVYGLQDKTIILGVASVWTERKGYNVFLELANMLDDSYKIVLVGVSENQKKNLPKNILGITRTNNVRELAQIYTAADVFLNPTLEDNFPTTNLESLACGTPIITFNTGGSKECENIDNGIVIQKENFEKLINTIQFFNNETFKMNKISELMLNYDKNLRYRNYIDIYLGV